MATLTDETMVKLEAAAKAAQSNRAALDVVRALNPKVADWLAAADPQTILALLQRIGDLEAELAIERSAVEVLATRAKSILGTVCQEGWRRCPLLRQDHQCGGALACGSIKGCNVYFADYARGEARKRLGLIERLREAEAQIGEEVTPKPEPEPEQPTVSCDDIQAYYDLLKPWPHTRFQGRDVLRGPEPEVGK